MNIVNKLTVRHLCKNRSRTLITIMGIMLSVAMVCAVAGFVMSLHDMLLRTIKESKGDWHIAYIDVTEETATKIADEVVYNKYYTKPGDTAGLVNIYLRLANPKRDCQDVARGIAEKYNVTVWGGNTELLALEGVISQDHDNVMKTITAIATIAIIIIVVGSVIVIANAFYISSSERVRQFGLLKSVGATKSQIGRSILFEAFLLAVAAIPLGIALGFLIQVVVLWLTNGLLVELSAINNGAFSFRVVFNPIIVCISVAIAAVTLLISTWLPASRAAKTSPIDAIRQTKDIRIRQRQLNTSPLTELLFGFEGTLASKSLKRSRGKYRATVISLTVSIVLSISVSSLVWVMNKGVEMEYGGYDFDVLITCHGELKTIDEADKLLNTVSDITLKKVQMMRYETRVPDAFMTEKARESVTTENGYGLLIHSLPDEQFAKLTPVTESERTGILINTTGAFTSNGRLVEYTPYNCSIGTELPIGFWEQSDTPELFGSVTITAVINEIPESIPASLFDGSLINIIVPESAYRELYRDDNSFTYYAVIVTNSDAFCENVEELLLPLGDVVSVWNLSQMTRLNRNLVLVVMLFGYGFIAMLSLIAVTSVISTISTSMALRKQEFAMLYSAGMTSGGMSKMLNLESLLYGVKSISIGLPIGVGLSYLIYWAMSGTVEFAYQLPLSSMLVSSAVVMLLTFVTMRYGKRKLSKISIVEALRSEVA